MVGNANHLRIGTLVSKDVAMAEVAIFPKDCTAELDSLDKSPTFAMSLGAKELFHTNFLAFLLESEAEELKSVKSELAKILFGPSPPERFMVWREKDNLDLVILPAPRLDRIDLKVHNLDQPIAAFALPDSFANNDVFGVVIEAKLKSIPTAEQLEGYTEKLTAGIRFELDENDLPNITQSELSFTWTYIDVKLNSGLGNSDCTFVLGGKRLREGVEVRRRSAISEFVRPLRRLLLSACKSERAAAGWDYLGWQQIVDAIECGLKNPSTDTALIYIVQDYAQSLSNLIATLICVERRVTTALDGPHLTYGEFYASITDRAFHQRRMSDLVGKYAMSIVRMRLLPKISVPTGNGFGGDGPPIEVDSYVHYSNQQPGFGIEWRIKHRDTKLKRYLGAGVQVQGTQYRHYLGLTGNSVSGPSPRSVAALLGSIVDPNSWWNSMNGVNFVKRTKGDPFFQFGENHFIYTQTSLVGVPVAQLEARLSKSMEALLRLLEGDNVNSKPGRLLTEFLRL